MGARMAPMEAPALKKPCAVARSFWGNHSALLLTAEACAESGDALHASGEGGEQVGDTPYDRGDGETLTGADLVVEFAREHLREAVGNHEHHVDIAEQLLAQVVELGVGEALAADEAEIFHDLRPHYAEGVAVEIIDDGHQDYEPQHPPAHSFDFHTTSSGNPHGAERTRR